MYTWNFTLPVDIEFLFLDEDGALWKPMSMKKMTEEEYIQWEHHGESLQ
jgi:hypothetical protein